MGFEKQFGMVYSKDQECRKLWWSLVSSLGVGKTAFSEPMRRLESIRFSNCNIHLSCIPATVITPCPLAIVWYQ
jgi:hypothetical protein